MHKSFFFVPSKSLFPQSCGGSVIKSQWPSSQIPWGFSVPLPDPQVGKSAVGPGTFAVVRELLWCNCSLVCGLSAWGLHRGINDDLLQEDLCHILCLQGLRQAEPLSPWQATADQTLQGRSDSVSVGSLGPGAHKVLFELSEHLWWVWSLILNTVSPLLLSCWSFSFALGCGISFFHGIQHSPVDDNIDQEDSGEVLVENSS